MRSNESALATCGGGLPHVEAGAENAENAEGEPEGEQGGRPRSTLDHARDYIARKWSPTPVQFKTKRPVLRDWQQRRITEAEAVRYFNGAPQNIGVLLGPASAGLCRWARAS